MNAYFTPCGDGKHDWGWPRIVKVEKGWLITWRCSRCHAEGDTAIVAEEIRAVLR